MEGGEKKCLCVVFWPEDHEFMEKMHFGASSSMNKLLLVARQILSTGLKKCH